MGRDSNKEEGKMKTRRKGEEDREGQEKKEKTRGQGEEKNII